MGLSLCAAATGLVLPSSVQPLPQVTTTVVRTGLGPFMQFDEEGGMVQGIEEGGMSFAEVQANYGAAGPSLSADKQTLCVLKGPEWNVNKMAVSATDEDFVLRTSSMGDAVCEIVIEPPFNTYEDYVVGFTADSSEKISIVHDESSGIEGRTDRRGGEPLVYKIRFEPQGRDCIEVAHLCCIYPEEKMYSKFYEIKGVTDGAGAGDDEATRDGAPNV